VITQLGGSPVQFPTPSQQSSQPPVSQTPAEAPVVSLVQVNELIKAQVTPLLNKVDNLESMISRLSQNQANIQEAIASTNNQVSSLSSTLEAFIKAQTPVAPTSSGGNSNDSNGGGTSSAPTNPLISGNIIKTSNGVKTRI
jgi:TolA-binding protein